MIPQQLEIKLSVEPNLFLASIDTDLGIYLFHGQDAMAIASFVEHYIDTDLHLEDSTMTATKTHRLVCELVVSLKQMLGDKYSEENLKQTYAIVQAAKTKGFLGPEKPRSICFVETVNIANDLLRIVKVGGGLLSEELKKPETLYVYIALVAFNAININTAVA